ncbi:hypothetical protein MHU86_13270 [Fragilaria crotonensis]|nr:hypothetical protein MHU86_13270 [Fragilaria crotonensis]
MQRRHQLDELPRRSVKREFGALCDSFTKTAPQRVAREKWGENVCRSELRSRRQRGERLRRESGAPIEIETSECGEVMCPRVGRPLEHKVRRVCGRKGEREDGAEQCR